MHPLILKLLVLCAPADFEAQSLFYRTDCTRRSKFLTHTLEQVHLFFSISNKNFYQPVRTLVQLEFAKTCDELFIRFQTEELQNHSHFPNLQKWLPETLLDVSSYFAFTLCTNGHALVYVRAFHPKTTTEARMRFLAAYAHTRNLIQ